MGYPLTQWPIVNNTTYPQSTYTISGEIEASPLIKWQIFCDTTSYVNVEEYVIPIVNGVAGSGTMVQSRTIQSSEFSNGNITIDSKFTDVIIPTTTGTYQISVRLSTTDGKTSSGWVQFTKVPAKPKINPIVNSTSYDAENYTIPDSIRNCPSVSWNITDPIMNSDDLTVAEFLFYIVNGQIANSIKIREERPVARGVHKSKISDYWNSLDDGQWQLVLQVNNNLFTINDYSQSIVSFTKNTNNAPTISSSTSNLGPIYSASQINLNYTIKDPDADKLIFVETCGGNSFAMELDSSASGNIQGTQLGGWFNSLNTGDYTITASVNDGRGGTASCTVSFTKVLPPNSAPTISPSSIAHGSSNTFKSLNNWAITDAEGGVITCTEVLDDTTTLWSGSITVSAGVPYTVTSKFDQTRWNTCGFGAHTVKFTATDSRGASVSGTQTFTKANYLPEITAITSENLGTVHADPKIQYKVTDKDSNYTITEYIDNTQTGTTYPNISANTTTTKTAVLNYSNLTFDTHKFKVVVQDLTTNLTVEKTWTFTRGYNAPIISGNDGAYGTYSGAPTITYEVYDPDNLRYSIIEYIDGNIFYSKDGCTGTYKGSMDLSTPWPSLSNGNHTIKIVATNTGNISATRTWTVVKDNKAPTISGNNVNLGNINSVLTYDYTVFDPEGDTFTVTEKVDGTILKTYTNCTGNKSFTLDLNTLTTSNKRRWDELSYNAVHTVDIVASDNQGQSATRTISFTKVNMPPTAPEFVTLTTGMRRGNRENNFTFDVEIKPNVDPDGDTQYLSVEAATNFSFTENVRVFEPTSYHKKAPDGSTWIECVSASNTDVVAGYIYKIPVSGLTENTEWYLRLVTTDKTGSGEVVKSTPIQISIGDTLEIETYPKDCLNNRPLYIRVEMNANIDPLADITVYTCNNAYDTSPTWEDCTAEYKNSTAYTYKNSTKTAATWAIGVRVKVVANNATGPIGISNLCISAKRQITT